MSNVSHPQYERLIGRIVLVYIDGWRYQRVIRINAGKRKGLRSLRVAGPQYEGRREDGTNRWSWNGIKRTVRLDVRNAQIKGVQFRRSVIPVAEFCKGGVA